MTSEEVQRTINFILRNQADAVIRMERWEERADEQQHKIDEMILAVREAAKAIHEAAKVSREHERRMRSLEKSNKRITRRVDGMRDILRILARLEARSGKRLDQLEKR